MIVIGLTGSIGMGKSTTAKMFARFGVPVHDADATVHQLYAGPAIPLIESAFPGTTADGKVDRAHLGKMVLGNSKAIRRLEGIIHPLVRQAEEAFLIEALAQGRRAVVLDSPLLLEKGGENRTDVCVLVTAAAGIQRQRVLARPGMTEGRFSAIVSKQMPDAEKRRRAHFLIDTGRGLEAAERQVEACLRALAPLPGRKSG